MAKKDDVRYTMYIDESGVASLTDKETKYCILTGVVIEREDDKQLEAYFNFIKRKYNIPEDKPFHSFDIFGNKGSSVYLKNADILTFAQSISEFLEIIPIKFFTYYIDKDDLRRTLNLKDETYFKSSILAKRDKDIGYEALATKLFLQYGAFLKRNKGMGRIITESRRNSDYALMRTYIDCRHDRHFSTKQNTTDSKLFDKRAYSISFEDKLGLSGGLQIADLISYVYYQSLTKRITLMEKRGIKLLWATIRSKNMNENTHKITGTQFEYLLSSNRVHKIINWNKSNN